ncbi:MAG: MoxR family ATPase [Candidatus Thermoplasmatota archaeon]|nr:MoxR family ATPase [Candidatus Thermoplasmatota archaeon]
MNLKQVGRLTQDLVEEVSKAIVGKEAVLRKVALAILADGHLLIEDYPGLGKTIMAKSFAAALGCEFKRVQFTPDLLPADITGTYMLDRKAGDFILRRGPVFTNVLLADEINRAPPKTQAALLEAMQERQTTLEGETHPLGSPFLVMATQNPIEFEGTYPLPEAQIDRFIMRIEMGYPAADDEVEMLSRRVARKQDLVEMDQIASPSQVLEMQAAVEEVFVEEDVERYVVELVHRTRTHSRVEVGASPRGSLALLMLSRAWAAIEGRDFVVPDDIKEIAVDALAHRLILKPDPMIRGVLPAAIVQEVLRDVPVPKVD